VDVLSFLQSVFPKACSAGRNVLWHVQVYCISLNVRYTVLTIRLCFEYKHQMAPDIHLPATLQPNATSCQLAGPVAGVLPDYNVRHTGGATSEPACWWEDELTRWHAFGDADESRPERHHGTVTPDPAAVFYAMLAWTLLGELEACCDPSLSVIDPG